MYDPQAPAAPPEPPAAERPRAAPAGPIEEAARTPRRRRWRPPWLILASAVWTGLAAALVVVSPGRWPFALAAVAANHLLLAAAGLWPRSALLGPNRTRLPIDCGDAVALTFDDGPDPEVTPAVLDLLEEAGARASFFLVGRRAEAHPRLVREIVCRGHRVENHTWRHANGFAAYGPWRMAREIDGAQQSLARLAGRPPRWFRPPAGFRNPWLDPLLARRGLSLVTWTRRGFDTPDGRPGRVAERLLRGLAAGDVLLLHDGNAAHTPAGGPVVLEVLPQLLRALADAGLRAVPLPPEGEDPDPGARGTGTP